MSGETLGKASNHLAVSEVLVLHGHFSNAIMLVRVAIFGKKCTCERTQRSCLEHGWVDQECPVSQLVTVEDNLVFTVWGDQQINNIHTFTNGLCNAVVSDTTFYADRGLPLGQYENIPMVLDRVVKVLTKMPKCKGTKKHVFVSNALHAVIFKCN